MPTIQQLDPDVRRDLVERLKRIEGQAKGIQKMIDEDRDCEQILTQVSAIKAATHALSGQMLEQYALYCMQHPDAFQSPEEAIHHMVSVVMKGTR